PLPALRVGAEALLQVIERASKRLEDEVVPGAADQLLVSLPPESQQVGVPAPGGGDVGEEAVVGAIQVAVRKVAVADRGAGALPPQAQQEGLVDGPGHARGAEPAIPALQRLERVDLALARRLEPSQPVDDLVAGDRVEVRLDAPEALQIVLLGLPQELL